MESIRYILKNKSLELYLPTKNIGKFRWKNREDNSKFGNVFPTKKTPFVNQSYIEWQIGYDMDASGDKKTSILDNVFFLNTKNKKKNPYELSEILYLMLKNELVSLEELKTLHRDIQNRNFSFDKEYQIETNLKDPFRVYDFKFHQQDIVLPTFSKYETKHGLSIEISIKQQQYASGTQPMVYFAIPIKNFINHDVIINKISSDVKEAILIISDTNKHFITDLFKVFGICSDRHKHDVLEILNILIKLFQH